MCGQQYLTSQQASDVLACDSHVIFAVPLIKPQQLRLVDCRFLSFVQMKLLNAAFHNSNEMPIVVHEIGG